MSEYLRTELGKASNIANTEDRIKKYQDLTDKLFLDKNLSDLKVLLDNCIYIDYF